MKPKSKKTVFRILSLSLTLCILLSACSPAGDPEGLFGTPESSTAPVREGNWDYDLSEVPYHYGNASTMLQGSLFCDYGEKVLFIMKSDPSVVCEFDKRTGKINPLCKDATCRHDSESCAAWGIVGLELYNGKIYGHRFTVDKEGKDVFQFTELKNGRFEGVLSSVNCFTHWQDSLYVTTNDGTFLKYSGDLKNPQTLKEDFFSGIHVIVNNDYYFTSDNNTIQRFSLDDPDNVEVVVKDIIGAFRTDGEYLYYTDFKERKLMRCNLDGSNPVQLTEIGVWPPSVNFDDEYIYFNGSDPTDETQEINRQIFRLKKDLSSEPELLANIGSKCGYIYTIYQLDALFLDQADGYYIINKDGTGLQKLELPV